MIIPFYSLAHCPYKSIIPQGFMLGNAINSELNEKLNCIYCFCFQPLASWLQMTAGNRKKFPESAWKASYYSSMWFTLYYLLVYTQKYDYFYKPLDIWEGECCSSFLVLVQIAEYGFIKLSTLKGYSVYTSWGTRRCTGKQTQKTL